jgi:hypothetical protein
MDEVADEAVGTVSKLVADRTEQGFAVDDVGIVLDACGR